MQDDGVGVEAIQQLFKIGLPSNVELVDLGTNLLALMNYFHGQRKIILVDALKKHHQPGTIYRLGLPEIEKIKQNQMTAHHISAVESLKILRQIDSKIAEAEIVMIGIEPETVDFGEGLSRSVRENMHHVINAICQEIDDTGQDGRSIENPEKENIVGI
jgi:hydrogenase maturation protease